MMHDPVSGGYHLLCSYNGGLWQNFISCTVLIEEKKL